MSRPYMTDAKQTLVHEVVHRYRVSRPLEVQNRVVIFHSLHDVVQLLPFFGLGSEEQSNRVFVLLPQTLDHFVH